MAEIPGGNVSIVIPAYAEENRIGRTVAALCAMARDFPRLHEVLVMVELSGDRTAAVAREAAAGDPLVAVHESATHRGKGFAVREGMMLAGGDIIFFMDADLSVPLSFVPPFVAHMEANPDTGVVIGSRRHADSRITRRQHPLREQAGRMFNRMVRLLGLSASKDTQCGFKAFRRAAAREIFSRAHLDGFAFDVEALCLARHLGLRVDERPIEWLNDSETKFHPLRDGWRSFRDLLWIRWLIKEA